VVKVGFESGEKREGVVAEERGDSTEEAIVV